MSKPFDNPWARHTMVKNLVFDQIMPLLSPSGWKVLCVTIRQTWGWEDQKSPTGRKQWDQISYSQFVKATGLSRTTVVKAVKECLDKNYLIRHQVGHDPNFHKPVYKYGLNTDFVFRHGTESDTCHGTESDTCHGTESGNTKETKETKKNDDGEDISESIRELESIGIAGDQARRWARARTYEHIHGLVRYAKTASGLRSPAAFVAARLRDNVVIEPSGQMAYELPEPRTPQTAEQKRLTDLWKRSLKELMGVDQRRYGQLLAGSALLSLTDGQAVISLRGDLERELCETAHAKVIQRILAGVQGDGSVVIEFITSPVPGGDHDA